MTLKTSVPLLLGSCVVKQKTSLWKEYRVEPLTPGSQAGEKEEALESSSSFLRGLPSLSSPTFYIFYSLVVRSVFLSLNEHLTHFIISQGLATMSLTYT